MGKQHQHGYTDVDRQENPLAWVRTLDLLHEEPFYRRYKARSLARLHVRAGGRYLDVGGGTGREVRRIEARGNARAVLLELSRTMAAEARVRGVDKAVVGDAATLPFADGVFDGCCADRTFQHLADPAAALRELARVTRSGGRIVVVDPDYDTQVVGVADQQLARRVRRFRADHGLRHGTLAHQMAGLFADAGLRDIGVDAMTLVTCDPAALDGVMGLRTWAEAAHEQGHLPYDDAARWPILIDEAIATGHFSYAVTFFLTSGTVIT